MTVSSCRKVSTESKLSGSVKTKIHDDVVKWVKSIQKAVGEAGDILLNDVDINFNQSVDKVKFVGNKEFLSLITKDQVGYLQVAELCPGDAKLDLVTPIPELRSGAVVRCSLVSTHLASAISIAVYQGGKEIHVSPRDSAGVFSFSAADTGEYRVEAKVGGGHAAGSPLTIPITADNTSHLAGLGLAPLKSEDGSCFKEGARCFAKWSEDQTWYNAVIQKVLEDGRLEVLFFDYGNSDINQREVVVFKREEIPRDDEVDENVEDLKIMEETAKAIDIKSTESKMTSSNSSSESNVVRVDSNVYAVGNLVFAKWAEDEVWYNAKILKIQDNNLSVEFVDYGNEDLVDVANIVSSVAAIPSTDDFDENIVRTEQSPLSDQENADAVSGPKQGVSSTASANIKTMDMKVDGQVIAKWSDNVWYNAKILKVSSHEVEVEFSDYGNTDTVLFENIVSASQEIPSSDDVDENVQVSRPSERIANSVASDANPPHLAPDPGSTSPVGVKIGDKLFAKWAEDQVWYNATVIRVEDKALEVLFEDYGNTDVVELKNVVESPWDIPVEDEHDEMVVIPPHPDRNSPSSNPSSAATATTTSSPSPAAATGTDKTFNIGDKVFAKWSDDVWYNAKILKVTSEEAEVEFPDYGNTDLVVFSRIVATPQEVPSTDDYDENVIMPGTEAPAASARAEDSGANLENAKTSAIIALDPAPSAVPTPVPSSMSNNPLESKHVFGVGSKGIAKWDEDQIWYNAEVLSTTAGGYMVRFVDYGNEAEVIEDNIVRSDESSKIPAGDTVDECVEMAKPAKYQVGDLCVARWREDGVFYNAEVIGLCEDGGLSVRFVDYGNEDTVVEVVRSAKDVPADSQLDDNVGVCKDSSQSASPALGDSGLGESVLPEYSKSVFLAHAHRDDVSKEDTLTAEKRMAIKGLSGPVGVGILADRSVAVVSRNDQAVYRYSPTSGKLLGQLELGGEARFQTPTDICVLSSGRVAVRDHNGIHLFNKKYEYKGKLGAAHCNKYYGVAEVGDCLVTINCRHGAKNEGPGNTTEKGQTDLFYFDTKKLTLVKRMEMVDIIDAETRAMSSCRSLAHDDGKLYVVDQGRDCVYCLYNYEGEESGAVFGDSGNKIGEFKRPVGVAVDECGTLIVVDSGNNRLQVVDSSWNFCGTIKVDRAVLRPSGIFYDRESSDLYVSNFAEGSVVCYRLQSPAT